MYAHMCRSPKRLEASNAPGAGAGAVVSHLTGALGTDTGTNARAGSVDNSWAISPTQSFESSSYSFACPNKLNSPLGSSSLSVR